MTTATMTVEMVVAAPVKVRPPVNDLWERLAQTERGAIVTNGHDRQVIKWVYGEEYRIRFVKDVRGTEKGAQWGRVYFTPRKDDTADGEVYTMPRRKHRAATVHNADKADKAAA
jgi:hypothetical protein